MPSNTSSKMSSKMSSNMSSNMPSNTSRKMSSESNNSSRRKKPKTKHGLSDKKRERDDSSSTATSNKRDNKSPKLIPEIISELYSKYCERFFGNDGKSVNLNYSSEYIKSRYIGFPDDFIAFLTEEMGKNPVVKDIYAPLLYTIKLRLEMHKSFYVSDYVDAKSRLFLVSSLIWICTSAVSFALSSSKNKPDYLKNMVLTLYVDKHHRICYCGEFMSYAAAQATAPDTEDNNKITRSAFSSYCKLKSGEREDRYGQLRELNYPKKGNEGAPMSSTASQANVSAYLVLLVGAYMVTAMFNSGKKFSDLSLREFTAHYGPRHLLSGSWYGLGIDDAGILELYLYYRTNFVTGIDENGHEVLYVNGCLAVTSGGKRGKPTDVGVVVDSSSSTPYQIIYNEIEAALLSINGEIKRLSLLVFQTWMQFLQALSKNKINIYSFLEKVGFESALLKSSIEGNSSPTVLLVYLSQLKIYSEQTLIQAGLPSTLAVEFLMDYDDKQYREPLFKPSSDAPKTNEMNAFKKAVLFHCLYLIYEKKIRLKLRSSKGDYGSSLLAKLAGFTTTDSGGGTLREVDLRRQKGGIGIRKVDLKTLHNAAGAHQDPIGVALGIANYLISTIYDTYLKKYTEKGQFYLDYIESDLGKQIRETFRNRMYARRRKVKVMESNLSAKHSGGQVGGVNYVWPNWNMFMHLFSSGILIYSKQFTKINTTPVLIIGHVTPESALANTRDEKEDAYIEQYITILKNLSRENDFMEIPRGIRAHSATLFSDYVSRLSVRDICRYSLNQAAVVLFIHHVYKKIRAPTDFVSLMTSFSTSNLPITLAEVEDLLDILEAIKYISYNAKSKNPSDRRLSRELTNQYFLRFCNNPDYDPLEEELPTTLKLGFEDAMKKKGDTVTICANAGSGLEVRGKLSKKEHGKLGQVLSQAFMGDPLRLDAYVEKYIEETEDLSFSEYPTFKQMVKWISDFVLKLETEIQNKIKENIDKKDEYDKMVQAKLDGFQKASMSLTPRDSRGQLKKERVSGQDFVEDVYFLDYADTDNTVLQSILNEIFEYLNKKGLYFNMDTNAICVQLKKLGIECVNQFSVHSMDTDYSIDDYCKIMKDSIGLQKGSHAEKQFLQCCFLEKLSHLTDARLIGNPNVRINRFELNGLLNVFKNLRININTRRRLKKLIMTTHYVYPYPKKNSRPIPSELELELNREIAAHIHREIFRRAARTIIASNRFRKYNTKSARSKGGSYKLRKQNKRKKTIKRKCKMNNKYKFKKTIKKNKRSKNLRKK